MKLFFSINLYENKFLPLILTILRLLVASIERRGREGKLYI